MIPTFILINQLHMVNTVWAILIPGAFNVWNMILARTYYQSVPNELREASAIDGANEIQHFFKIMLPVCKPIIAVLMLWSFVGMWNSYFDAMIYLNDANLQPLQLVLRSILVQNTPQPGMIADIQSTAEMAKVAEQLKYATIVVSSLPLLIMYPFSRNILIKESWLDLLRANRKDEYGYEKEASKINYTFAYTCNADRCGRLWKAAELKCRDKSGHTGIRCAVSSEGEG